MSNIITFFSGDLVIQIWKLIYTIFCNKIVAQPWSDYKIHQNYPTKAASSVWQFESAVMPSFKLLRNISDTKFPWYRRDPLNQGPWYFKFNHLKWKRWANHKISRKSSTKLQITDKDIWYKIPLRKRRREPNSLKLGN